MKIKFILLTLIVLIFISCSQKAVTLRRLEDIHKAEKKLKKNPNNEDVIRSLIDAAQNGNREVRAESLWILAKTKTQLAYSDFLKYSVEDPDFNVRSMAIFGLKEIDAKNPEAIERINRAMSDIDQQVQIEALNIAGEIKDTRLLNQILNNLSSKNKWIRMASVNALKDYKDNRVEKALKLISTTDADFAVRSMALQIMEYRIKNELI